MTAYVKIITLLCAISFATGNLVVTHSYVIVCSTTSSKELLMKVPTLATVRLPVQPSRVQLLLSQPNLPHHWHKVCYSCEQCSEVVTVSSAPQYLSNLIVLFLAAVVYSLSYLS